MKKARFSLQYLTTQARMLGMFNIFINLIGPHTTKQIHTYVVHNFAYYLQSLVLFLKKHPNILQCLHLYQNCFEAQDILSGQNPLIWPLHIPIIQVQDTKSISNLLQTSPNFSKLLPNSSKPCPSKPCPNASQLLKHFTFPRLYSESFSIIGHFCPQPIGQFCFILVICKY